MPASARALTRDTGHGLLLQADARQPISLGAHTILAGILVNLVRVFAVNGNCKARARSLEVVIRLRPGSRTELFLVMPLRNDVLIYDSAAPEIVAGGFLFRTRIVSCGIVRENEDMFAILMFEVIADAFFFHQPGNEIEVCLAILHAIIARREISIQPKFEILKLQVRENLLDDVGDGLVLKNPAIGGARQEPQPRNHLRSVGREAPILRALRESIDEPIPVTLGAVRIKDAQRDVLSNQVLKLDRVILRQQIEIEVEQLRDRFSTGE